MYAICSTKKDDVLNCVVEMVKTNKHFPIVQFGATKYKALEKDRGKVYESCQKVINKSEHVVNLKTRRIHKKGCSLIGKSSQNIVGARLINTKHTGLKLCAKCMK